MNRIIALLKEPHPAHTDPRVYLRTITIITAGVFYILYIIRPFDWAQVADGDLLVTALASSGATFVGLTLFYLWRYLFPAFFAERQWTFGKEALLVLHQFTVVAFAVWAVRTYCGQFWYVPQRSYLFTWWTVCATGAIPYLLATSLKLYYRLRRNLAEAAAMTVGLGGDRGHGDRFVLPRGLGTIYGFLFAESVDNYVEVHWLAGGEIHRERFRCTLLEIEECNPQPAIFRCHRGYVANLDAVVHVEGNAAGFHLLMHAELPTVPVSRSCVPSFRRLMTGYQARSGQNSTLTTALNAEARPSV